MPELPEVETIRRQLEQTLLSQQVVAYKVFRHDMIHGAADSLIGSTLLGARRFGKLLVIDFSSQTSILIHLKMTGRVTLIEHDSIQNPSATHAVLTLSNSTIAYSDTRRFGYLRVLPSSDVASFPFIKSLGKEPLKDLTIAHFYNIHSRSSRAIKTFLLDQTRIAGLGNIYACESLWMAGIHPEKPAHSLTEDESKRLFLAIEDVLQEGIDRGGASDNTYRDLLGEKGSYQDFFKVYGRDKKNCLVCGTRIERSVLGGRGTWFCPQCQPIQ